MDIAVIGAGFGGMLAAFLLEKKGFNVTIYEKNESIGGHCNTLVSRDVFSETGTVFSFTNNIKELLIDLDIDYTEQFVYKRFIDSDYSHVEQMSQTEVLSLIDELKSLEIIYNLYSSSLNNTNYGYIDPDLLVTFKDFTTEHKLFSTAEIIKPFLSSFGFGCIDRVQAYYVLKVFNLDIIKSYINGEKILFFKKGTSQVIKRLSRNISDIRYSMEVTSIELTDNKVKVDTKYNSDTFDKVLITTKLPNNVIKDKTFNNIMREIETTPFMTCTYEVNDSDSVSTYYKANLGIVGKIQFFHIIRKSDRTILVAYAYGFETPQTVKSITMDIEALGIDIRRLITVKQWHIFPHVTYKNLTPGFYTNIIEKQHNSSINFIGSLISEPSIDNLYLSIKNSVKKIVSAKD